MKGRVFQQESVPFPEYEEMLNFLTELETESPTASAASSYYEVPLFSVTQVEVRLIPA